MLREILPQSIPSFLSHTHIHTYIHAYIPFYNLRNISMLREILPRSIQSFLSHTYIHTCIHTGIPPVQHQYSSSSTSPVNPTIEALSRFRSVQPVFGPGSYPNPIRTDYHLRDPKIPGDRGPDTECRVYPVYVFVRDGKGRLARGCGCLFVRAWACPCIEPVCMYVCGLVRRGWLVGVGVCVWGCRHVPA